MRRPSYLDHDRLAKLRSIATSVCNCFGIPSLGSRKINMTVTAPLKEKVCLPMEEIGKVVRTSREAESLSNVTMHPEIQEKIVFAAANDGGRAVAKLLDISDETAEALCGKLEKYKFKVGKAIPRVVQSMKSARKEIVVGSVRMGSQSISFAKTFAYSRVWNAMSAPPKLNMLRAACKKFVEIPPDAAASRYREIESFLAAKGAARKSAYTRDARMSLYYNLSHECGKAFFKYGVLPHPAFTQWAEDAVAAAYAWEKAQPELSSAAQTMYDGVFALSCIDRMEPIMMDRTLDSFIEAIMKFDEAKVPPGIGLLWMFETRGEYDSRALCKMLRRINAICKRRPL